MARRHREKHFTGSATVSDIILGMSDGLTVPFALAAGLAGAVSDPTLVLVGGFAELAAGGISMGLGGYLAGQSEADSYRAEMNREYWEYKKLRPQEIDEVREILAGYGLQGELREQAAQAICADKDICVRFMMREELGLEKPESGRARQSALTIGGAYVGGGLIPLLPYAFGLNVHLALLISAVVTGIALLLFGAFKGKYTGIPMVKSAFQTFLVGGLAAATAYAIARVVSGIG